MHARFELRNAVTEPVNDFATPVMINLLRRD